MKHTLLLIMMLNLALMKDTILSLESNTNNTHIQSKGKAQSTANESIMYIVAPVDRQLNNDSLDNIQRLQADEYIKDAVYNITFNRITFEVVADIKASQIFSGRYWLMIKTRSGTLNCRYEPQNSPGTIHQCRPEPKIDLEQFNHYIMLEFWHRPLNRPGRLLLQTIPLKLSISSPSPTTQLDDRAILYIILGALILIALIGLMIMCCCSGNSPPHHRHYSRHRSSRY